MMQQQETMILREGQALEQPKASLPHPWFARASQAVSDVELLTAEDALQAFRWEWSAVWWSSRAVEWLAWGAEQALRCWLAAGLDVQRATEGWQAAVSWLGEHGDPLRVVLYQPLFDHAEAQKRRLEEEAAQVAASAAWVSSTWGVAVPEEAVQA